MCVGTEDRWTKGIRSEDVSQAVLKIVMKPYISGNVRELNE